MPFLIDADDGPDAGALREQLRPDHLDYLVANAAVLLMAGAKLDELTQVIGSAYAVDVETREQAEQFISGDPYQSAGVFGSVRITRWRKGFFDGARVSTSEVVTE